MKKISYILQFNAFMDKRFDDELSPAASLLYMIIFSEFNRLHWRDEWIYISSRMLTLQMGNHSNSTISRNLKKLGECKIVCVKSNCADLFYAPYWGKQLKGWISNGKT